MQVQGLTLRAGKRLLLDSLDWQVAPGQCWAVIGRNGAGKSTLLRTLAGLRDSDAGSLHLDGRALSEWAAEALARRRAYLAQGRSDAFGYRVIDAVLAGRHPWRAGSYWDSAEDEAVARRALAQLDVSALEQRDLRTLSGGERQRVAIAAVLAQETPLLLLDEPATALDLAHQVAVMNLLARLCRHEGRSVVMVSHDLNMAHATATHALLMMPDGSWRAGAAAETLLPGPLEACLGHPIEIVEHGGRRLFLPAAEARPPIGLAHARHG